MSSLDELIAGRRALIEKIRARGENPFANDVYLSQDILNIRNIAYGGHTKEQVICNLAKDPFYYDLHIRSFMKDGDAVELTYDDIKRFFQLKFSSPILKASINRSGAYGFDIVYYTTLNGKLLNEAIECFNLLLEQNKNNQWPDWICDWSINYETGIAQRHFSGDVKDIEAFFQKLQKSFKQKLGKNLIWEGI